jgi:heme/copper-type cytochrome/quinol oxidase subunit 1
MGALTRTLVTNARTDSALRDTYFVVGHSQYMLSLAIGVRVFRRLVLFVSQADRLCLFRSPRQNSFLVFGHRRLNRHTRTATDPPRSTYGGAALGRC